MVCAFALLGAPAALPGCATGVAVIAPGQKAEALPADSDRLPRGDVSYVVSPLDTLQIDVYPQHVSTIQIDVGSQIRIEASFADRVYAISPGDGLSIELNAENAQPTQLTVRPDGLITLPHLSKDIMAAGRTPSALANAISQEYAAVMRAPEVTVSVTSSDLDMLSKIDGTYQVGADGTLVLPVLGAFSAVGKTASSLSGQISGAARARFHNAIRIAASIGQQTGRDVDPRIDPDGRSYFRGPAKVSPDGKIYLPPGGSLHAAGLTLAALRAQAVTLLQPLYANPIDVSASVAESSSLSVFIGGEVKTPGRYNYAKAMTLIQLLATAGWVTDVGDLDRVLLLHASAPGHYTVYRTNLQEVFEEGAVAQDLSVAPQDIVVVPITGIGQVDRVVDQYIRRVLPFSTAATFSYINPVASAATNSVTGH